MRSRVAASRSIDFADAEREQKNAAAYLELHIEQGPVLERMGLPLGVVLGTKGVERHAITFYGQEAHSGSTPMKARRDALAAAAKLALEIRSIARKHRRCRLHHGQREDVSGHRDGGGGALRNDARPARSGRRSAGADVSARRTKRVSALPRKSAAPWSGRGSGASSRCRFIRP